MRNFLITLLVSCFYLFAGAYVFAVPDEVPYDNGFQEHECKQVNDSCTVEYLSSVLCIYRPHLCISDDQITVLSWGLLSTVYATELASFNVLNQTSIDSSDDSIDEQLEFIHHEVLEHIICMLEGDLCLNGSYYNNNDDTGCAQNPRVCSTE